jgi:Asp-tRNA(Asn)/Glu-tRNA(Gln) amidotransferase C subunit
MSSVDNQKKKKKVLVKKKKGEKKTSVPATKQSTPAAPSFDTMFDPQIFDFLKSMPTLVKGNMEETMKSVTEEQLKGMSEKQMQELMMNNLKKSLPQSTPSTSKAPGGFDMGEMMSMLMTKADEMMKDEKMPSVFEEPPEAPTERSGKYGTEEQKKSQLIYKGFNLNLLSIFTTLKKILPEKASLYSKLERIVDDVINIDPTKPMKMWRESVKGFEDRLMTYSEENVLFICNNLDKIELLSMLELQPEIPKLTSSQLKDIWTKLNQCQYLCEITDSVPVPMMNAIQNLTLRVNDKTQVKLDDQKKLQNTPELFKTLTEEVFKDEVVYKGMRQMSANIMKSLMESQIPEPPAYLNAMKNAEDSVT